MQLFKISILQAAFLIVFATLNTLLSFGIIYIINNALSGKNINEQTGIAFLSMIGYSYLLNIIFQKVLNKYSFELLYKNEIDLFKILLNSPLSKLEQAGTQRFYTTVEDLRTFAYLPYTVSHTINSLLMIVLCIIYMFSLSWVAAFIVVVLIALVAGCYFWVMSSMSKKVENLRNYNDQYYQYVNDVVNGFESLKLDVFKRINLIGQYLSPNRNKAESLDYEINYVFLSINMISQFGLYFVIAIILFLFPYLGILEHSEVISYVVIVLFISGPINNLVNLQQIYTRFAVANSRIKKFVTDFSGETRPATISFSDTKQFDSLNFRNITYHYDTENEDNSFCLGPVDIKINRNETLFIIGGNGSGKSTFIKILTGLYTQSNGEILLNDMPVENKDDVQQLMSAVFTNNHLFAYNYQNIKFADNPEYQDWLKIMHLDQVVTHSDDNEIRTHFSKGQSKRMSLIYALMEKKPIIVLDEWAADQDPHFRKYFYETLIPKLKAEGKTIIAVTHDDAYFHQADRILKFEYGKLTKDVMTNNLLEFKEIIWE